MLTVLGDTISVACSPMVNLLESYFMRPTYRSHVNKHRSAGKFRSDSRRTKGANMSGAPMRGGIRL